VREDHAPAAVAVQAEFVHRFAVRQASHLSAECASGFYGGETGAIAYPSGIRSPSVPGCGVLISWTYSSYRSAMTCRVVLVRSQDGGGGGGRESTLPQEKQRMGMIMFVCWVWSEGAPLMFQSKCWWWRTR